MCIMFIAECLSFLSNKSTRDRSNKSEFSADLIIISKCTCEMKHIFVHFPLILFMVN